MNDPINRQDAIRIIDNINVLESGWFDKAIKSIKDLPSAQPERKTGRWEFQGDQMFMCTCCCYLASQKQLESWRVKKADSVFPLFCPNCGADMKGDQYE